MPLIFWFNLFLEARAEILTKISLVFLVDLKTPKRHFEINWPLLEDKKAEAALRSSSKSETVNSELPIDLVAEAEHFDICMVDNQSSTLPPTDE